MRNFFKGFEEAMSAAAFAEAGEFDTAREMLGQGKNSNKKVLLGTEGVDVDHKAFRYAFNLCQRVGARLEILHVLGPSVVKGADNLEGVLSAIKVGLKPVFDLLTKEGVEYRLNFGEGRLEEEVARYAEGRRDILFVVIRPPEKENRQKAQMEKRIYGALKKLNCPLAVVSDAAKA